MIFKDGTKRSALAHNFDNGLKLMEHSWVGNRFVNAVMYEMVDNPVRLAWVGDYSDSAIVDGCNLGGGYITSASEFLKMFTYLWENIAHRQICLEILPHSSSTVNMRTATSLT